MSPGEGNGNLLQYSCLENPMAGGAWWAAVHEVAGSRTRLSDFAFTFHFHALEKEIARHSSCQENPRDGGAWWAAVYRVAQSRTRLKRLSSMSPVWATSQTTHPNPKRRSDMFTRALRLAASNMGILKRISPIPLLQTRDYTYGQNEENLSTNYL